ncbi:N-acetylglucosamine-6-phosphate deacetylase isoform X2, partial [Scomber scombrus]
MTNCCSCNVIFLYELNTKQQFEPSAAAEPTDSRGGYGIDFSQPSEDVSTGISFVAKKILEHGVTSFCPTLVTSPPAVYHKVLPQVKVHNGGQQGAGVL